ncbi:urocanate hydratase [Halogeometricum borinquense DSM 11551]|uniref:Probable urocanate hydratase n=2 Tax=Halogeometricum borinquense TaxID=60847 RepID=E4NT43_HALBP|nr:urocanate hydratase [Halogeometricum borinquense]ADQ67036.1 urocanate hydratase [Halogeometricum borinquense DSM 11551]ELY29827.1 urocanate hydratase [Halogeometricum borinquense DSM 11551]RYJ13984.1 urocanate hydratase [Halogeometricum borinquense]
MDETDSERHTVGEPSDEWRRYQGSPTGTDIECEGWRQEAALRMLNNNLDPEVAERPEDLVVYGGTGRAARSWDAYDAILGQLRELDDDETLLVQSGKPVGRFTTHERAPRVLIANSNLVGKWDDWDHFHELEAEGKIMYGQMTAGSWAYIGTQGILQGTYETLAEAGRRHFPDDEGLRGRIVVTGGLGGMGGAQPLAVTMNRGVCIAAEVDEHRIDRRIETGYCMEKTDSVAEAIERAEAAAEEGEPLSIAVHGNAADVLEEMLERGFVPDVVTDQTSAHDELEGYYPSGYTVEEADELREEDPDRYVEESIDTMERHVDGILEMQARGAVAFEYGNNIRGQVEEYKGRDDVFDFPGFVPAYIRPLFCRGKGPFRWAALSGDPEDIHRTDDAVLELFPEDDRLSRWIELAREQVQYQGLPSRVCWLGYRTDEEGLTERARFALRINELVAEGEISAPVVVTRDHLDAGSVASPHRETEAMRDGTDAVADWPILNALLNCAAGADIVSVHDGGGVGIGNALHTNNHVVLDGSDLAAEKARAVFTTDPGMGVIRHADAGYEEALDEAERSGAHVPIDPEDTGPAGAESK